MIALGIGLCSISEDFPTGKAIVEAIKGTTFVGSSGPVSFNNYTGTRAAKSVKFKVINFLVDASESLISYEFQTSSMINISAAEVEVLTPFMYSDGTTVSPQPLASVTDDLNLVTIDKLIFGWTLACIVILLSILCGCWTYHNRDRSIIRVAQPLFLVLLCVGTILMASAIIPMSFQEPMSQKTLDRACMAMPWLFVMGFSTAFSSLFCKLSRINKVRWLLAL